MLEVFDVGHGQCILFRSPNGRVVLIDCAHAADSGWHPADVLLARGIRHVDALVVSILTFVVGGLLGALAFKGLLTLLFKQEFGFSIPLAIVSGMIAINILTYFLVVIAAFKEDIRWGFACILPIWIIQLVFVIMHFKKAQKAGFTYIISIVVSVILQVVIMIYFSAGK